jgi:hypothetical protein
VWPSAIIGRCCGLHAVRGVCTGFVSRQKLELKGLLIASLVVMFSSCRGPECRQCFLGRWAFNVR